VVTACVAVLTILVLPAAATAAPVNDSAVISALSPGQLVDELAQWITGWLDEAPVRSVHAPGGHTIDPNGSPSPGSGDGGTVSGQGGGTIDPNG
jgi:hypothetical protein